MTMKYLLLILFIGGTIFIEAQEKNSQEEVKKKLPAKRSLNLSRHIDFKNDIYFIQQVTQAPILPECSNFTEKKEVYNCFVRHMDLRIEKAKLVLNFQPKASNTSEILVEYIIDLKGKISKIQVRSGDSTKHSAAIEVMQKVADDLNQSESNLISAKYKNHPVNMTMRSIIKL